MKLLVIVPGFGESNWDAKVEILRKNIDTVRGFFTEYTFRIVQYTLEKDLPADILSDANIEVIKDTGILGRNLHVHAPPSYVDDQKPDYVMLILDDVELQAPFDWQQVLGLSQAMNLDVASPVLTSRSMTVWNFMTRVSDPNVIAAIMTRCELFCYIMKPSAYAKYYSFVDPMNPWMWGMDFMLHTHMNLRVGLLQNVCMIHHFWRTSPTHDPKHDPSKDQQTYLEKYSVNWNELQQLPSVIEIAIIQ